MKACVNAGAFWALVTLITGTGIASAAPNPVVFENNKPGTTDWQLTNPGWTSSIIEGYASRTSVNRGESIAIFVNTAEPGYTLDIFRMGYYGGLGGRRMQDGVHRVGTAQPPPTVDPVTGLTECQWTDPYMLQIPNPPDPTEWMSGVYLVKLTSDATLTQQYVVFVVRDDARPSDFLLAQTVNTYQAYNPWGGKSLYGTIASRADTANAARKVSFSRPYYGEDGNGAATFFHWEYPMIQWLEGFQYDVSYATNVDVDRDPMLLFSHKAFLSVGHDEYWSWKMRDNVEAARDGGVSLGFFSGNTSYWQVRYEASPVNSDPFRTLVSYKDYWYQDPIEPDNLKTNEFRYRPVNRPEDAMIGVMYITQARPAMVVEDASHWVFTGTGLQNGSVLTNADGSPFLGYEIDEMGPESPPNTQRLAHSPDGALAENYSDMTVYRADSGATVFATGSIGWSITVPEIQQITHNVLARFKDGTFYDTVPVRPALPAPLAAADIGDVGRPGFVGAVGPQSLTLNGAGQDMYYGTDDALYYAYQPMSGDGAIVARLTNLQLAWDNRAGVMIRDSLSPDAAYVALVGRPTGSAGVLLEGAELLSRDSTGNKNYLAGIDIDQPTWLRLSRSGDTFTASVSPDGATWTVVGSTSVAMGSDVFIGINVASATRAMWVTASFDNVSITSGGQ